MRKRVGKLLLGVAVPLILMLSGLALYLFFHPKDSASEQAAPARSDDKKVDFPEPNAKNALEQYLRLKGLKSEDWTWEDDHLVARNSESAFDRNNERITLTHTLDVLASGQNDNTQPVRQAFVIQYAIRQPKAEYPEHDSYTCDLLVLAPGTGGWTVEALDRFEQSGYEGGTRWAKSCNNFQLSWEDGFPVLQREQIYGPYAAGVYATMKQKVSRIEGKYKLVAEERSEVGDSPDTKEQDNN